MNYRHSILTKKEQHVMEIFWREERPLTSVDLHEIDRRLTNNYLHFILKNLQKKGFLETMDKVRYEHRSAQSFRPLITRPEYLAQMSRKLASDSRTVPNFLMAFYEHQKESTENQALLSQLEELISKVKPK